MKKTLILFLCALALGFSCTKLIAVTVSARVDFTPGPENPGTVEHFVEREIAGVWTEIAKGPAAPITVSIASVTPGTVIKVRVKTRIPGVAGSETAPSNVTQAVVPLQSPANVGIILTVQ